MSRQNKKERQRLKRKRKQQELRKKRNMSVFQTLSRSEGELECYINAGWLEAGEASIMVIRPTPGGSNVSVAFLIDLWCSGLKDAFGRMNITRGEFEEHLLGAAQRDVEMIPLDLLTARRLVAGGMRLCVENGFRLPHKADRWASIIGVTGYADADLSDFEKPEGKYRYVGSMQDLRKRLVGPVDDFLDREDVEFVIGDGPFSQWEEDEYEDEDDLYDDEYDEENEDNEIGQADDESIESAHAVVKNIELVRERGLKLIEEWLNKNQRTPHPRLGDGFHAVILATLARGMQEESAEPLGFPSLDEICQGDADPSGMAAAIDQVAEFIAQKENKTPMRMLLEGDEFPAAEGPPDHDAGLQSAQDEVRVNSPGQ